MAKLISKKCQKLYKIEWLPKYGYDVLAKCNQVCEKIPDSMQKKTPNDKTYFEKMPKIV